MTTETVLIEIESLNRKHTQLRFSMSRDAIGDYAELMTNPKNDMPPVVVFATPRLTNTISLMGFTEPLPPSRLVERPSVATFVLALSTMPSCTPLRRTPITRFGSVIATSVTHC